MPKMDYLFFDTPCTFSCNFLKKMPSRIFIPNVDIFLLSGSWKVAGIGSYPDFLAMLMPLLMMTIVCLGAHHSTVFNKIVTAINLAVVLFVIGVGLWHLDTKNWTPRENFAPNGASGILAGAASCFFCFVGFDVIATAGEETVNPRRNIPLSIVLSLLISFFCYFGVATVLTMMVSYKDLTDHAPLANAFGDHAFKVLYSEVLLSNFHRSHLPCSLYLIKPVFH